VEKLKPDAIAPDGAEIYFRELGAKRASLVEVVLGPGGVSRAEQHRTVEEIWYFLAGTGEVWIGGKTGRVTEGSTVVIPNRVAVPVPNAGRRAAALSLFHIATVAGRWRGNSGR